LRDKWDRFETGPTSLTESPSKRVHARNDENATFSAEPFEHVDAVDEGARQVEGVLDGEGDDFGDGSAVAVEFLMPFEDEAAIGPQKGVHDAAVVGFGGGADGGVVRGLSKFAVGEGEREEIAQNSPTPPKGRGISGRFVASPTRLPGSDFFLSNPAGGNGLDLRARPSLRL
jgi:hypothetical protein